MSRQGGRSYRSSVRRQEGGVHGLATVLATRLITPGNPVDAGGTRRAPSDTGKSRAGVLRGCGGLGDARGGITLRTQDWRGLARSGGPNLLAAPGWEVLSMEGRSAGSPPPSPPPDTITGDTKARGIARVSSHPARQAHWERADSSGEPRGNWQGQTTLPRPVAGPREAKTTRGPLRAASDRGGCTAGEAAGERAKAPGCSTRRGPRRRRETPSQSKGSPELMAREEHDPAG